MNNVKCKIISLLLGFLIATILSTIPGQTGDWDIIAASILVTSNETISRIVYRKNSNKYFILTIINDIKIGIIYGLFVDAFKLGS